MVNTIDVYKFYNIYALYHTYLSIEIYESLVSIDLLLHYNLIYYKIECISAYI